MQLRGNAQRYSTLRRRGAIDPETPFQPGRVRTIKTIRDKATLRRIAIAAQHLMTRALLAEEDPSEFLVGAEDLLRRLSQGARTVGVSFPDETTRCTRGGRVETSLGRRLWAVVFGPTSPRDRLQACVALPAVGMNRAPGPMQS